MTPARLLAVALVAATALTAAPAGAAKRKPVKGSYDLTLPVPYPMEGSDGSHCRDAPAGLSKDERSFVLAWRGTFRISLTDTVGDWVVEIHDAKRNLLMSGGSLDLAGSSLTLLLKKKRDVKETYIVMVCNYTGGPYGHVDWTYTPA